MLPRPHLELVVADRAQSWSFGANRDTGLLGQLADKLHKDPEAILGWYGALIAKTVPGIEPAVRVATLGLVGTEDIYKTIGKLIFEVAKLNTDLADVLTVIVMEPSILVPPFFPGPATVLLAIEKLTRFHLERYLIAMVVAPVLGPALVLAYDAATWAVGALGNLLGLGGPSVAELARTNQILTDLKREVAVLSNLAGQLALNLSNPDDLHPALAPRARVFQTYAASSLTTMRRLSASFSASMHQARLAAPPLPVTSNNYDNAVKFMSATQYHLNQARITLGMLLPLTAPVEEKIRVDAAARVATELTADAALARIPEIKARAQAARLDDAYAARVRDLLTNAARARAVQPQTSTANVAEALKLVTFVEEANTRMTSTPVPVPQVQTGTGSSAGASAEGGKAGTVVEVVKTSGASRTAVGIGAGLLLWGLLQE